MTLYEKELRQKYPQFFEKQICRICGKEFYLKYSRIKTIVLSLKRGKNFFIACCNSHSAKIQQEILGSSLSNLVTRQKARKTKELKYGSPTYNNPSKNRQTKVDRYGDPNYNNRNKCFDTKQRRYNDKNYNNRVKAHSTMNTKYGDHYTKTNLFKQDIEYKGSNKTQLEKKQIDLKRRETKFNKYNDENYNNISKSKKTKLERYNDENYNNQEKSISTNLKKRGVKYYSQTQEYKDLYKNKEWVEKRNQKHYETLIKNKTYNKPSKPEDKINNQLIQKFGGSNIVRPFRNNLYPFKCDFYIKPLDLFIECHFSQYHQGKPFDINSKQDWIKLLYLELNAVKMIRQKGRAVENQYENMIYTWTDLDVRKLETFKKNNLNYKIFYTEKEFNEWFQNL